MDKSKTLFSMDLIVRMAVEELAKQMRKSQEDVLVDFMGTNTARMLYDDSTKLWCEGPSAVAEMFRKEISASEECRNLKR